MPAKANPLDSPETLRALDRLVEEETRQHQAAIARTVERGGLPKLLDVADLEDDLDELFNKLEEFATDAEAVGNSTIEDEIPFAVTVEHVAAVALVVDAVNSSIGNYRTLVARIDGQLFGINLVRQQQAKAEAA